MAKEPPAHPASEPDPSPATGGPPDRGDDAGGGGTRTFTDNGVKWRVEIAGRGTAGTGRFAHLGIQLLRFSRLPLPSAEVLELVTPLMDPGGVSEDELRALLREAKPPAPPREPEDSGRVPLDEADPGSRRDFE